MGKRSLVNALFIKLCLLFSVITFQNCVPAIKVDKICDMSDPAKFIREAFIWRSTTNQEFYCNLRIRDRANPSAPGAFSLTGTVSGLTRQSMTITSGTSPNQTLTINSGSTAFAFPQNFISGESYSITMTNNSQGNVCSISNPNGTVPASNIAIICRPIFNVYTLEGATGILRIFETDNSGNLIFKSQIATTISGGLLLYNNKFIIAADSTSFRSYLRNPDGSLTFTQSFSVNATFACTPSIHPNGRFIFYTKGGGGGAPLEKLEIDTNGNFLNLQNPTTAGQWLITSPISPNGNYIWSFHKTTQVQSNYAVNSTTGFVSNPIANTPQITTPLFYPENANCVFSLNGNNLYCAQKEFLSLGNVINQMSINSSNFVNS